MRKITIFQTRGKKKSLIETDATTFGDLQKLFQDNGIEFNAKEMSAMESINNTSLETPLAILPEGDFTIGIFPKKTKAGTVDRKALYARIKEFVARDGKEVVNAYFMKHEGKHYTNISSDRLQTIVDSYAPVVSTIKATKATKPVTPPVVQKAGKEDVLTMLKGLGVSTDTLAAVKGELQGTVINVDMDWINAMCRSNPLLSC